VADPLGRAGPIPDIIPIARGLGVHVVGDSEDADAIRGGEGGAELKVEGCERQQGQPGDKAL
jgi:hypothetical protein